MSRRVATAEELRRSPPAPTAPRARTPLWSLVPGRLASADPLIGLVGAVSFVVYVLHGFEAALTRDLGVYTYAGQRFLAGDPPYVAIMNRAGPLAHVLPAVGIWLGRLAGVGDIHGARAFFMLLAVGCVCLVYVVVRDLTRCRAAAVIAAAGFLSFEGFLDLAASGPREKTPMALFLLAALLALLHRRWATSGILIALATLTWQPVFFVAAVAALVAALLAPDRRAQALARIGLGGAATSAVVLVYYAANGALHTFFEGFLLINAQYTRQPHAWSDPAGVWGALRSGYGPGVWVVLLGLAAVLVLGVVSAGAAWRTREVAAVTWVSLGAGCLGGLIWSSTAFNGWADSLVLLPFAAIGVGGCAAAVIRRLNGRVAVPVTVTLALIGTAYATGFSVTTRRNDLSDQRAAIATILHLGPRHATMLSVQAPEVLVMTHRVNPTPYQMYGWGFSDYVDHTYPGGLAGFVAWIDRSAPTYIVMESGMRPWWLLPYLQEHYRKVRAAPQFDFWVSRSAVKHRVRLAMRQASKAAAEARS